MSTTESTFDRCSSAPSAPAGLRGEEVGLTLEQALAIAQHQGLSVHYQPRPWSPEKPVSPRRPFFVVSDPTSGSLFEVTFTGHELVCTCLPPGFEGSRGALGSSRTPASWCPHRAAVWHSMVPTATQSTQSPHRDAN